MTDLSAIEERRLRLGVTIGQLERAAGISNGHYTRLLKGTAARPTTIAKIEQALSRLEECVFKLCVAIVAMEAGTNAAFVFSHDPAKRATANPDWMRAAELRRKALYMANVVVGLPQATLARAAGMTKSAVSLAMQELEADRPDSGEDFFSQFEEALQG
jgi:transcriptional regulator with XRE-family HTH domain